MNAFHFECMLRHQLYIYSLKQASTSMKDCEPSQATVLSLLKLILMLNEEEKESQEHHVPAGSGLPLHSADKTSAMKSTREKFFGQNNVQTESDRGGRKRTVEGGDTVRDKEKMREAFDDTIDLCRVDVSLRDAASLHEKPSHSSGAGDSRAVIGRPATQVPSQPDIETLSAGRDAQEISAHGGDNSGTDDGAQRQAPLSFDSLS